MPAPFNTAFSVQAAYMKILESSQTLLHVLKRETASWQHGSRNGGCGGPDGDIALMVGCASNLPMKGKSWFTFGASLWTDKATVYHIRTVSTLYLDWNTSISESWCPFDRGLANFPSADVTFWGGVIIEILVICLDENNIYQVRMGTPVVYSNHGWSSTRRFTAKVNLTKKKQGSDWWDSLEDGETAVSLRCVSS